MRKMLKDVEVRTLSDGSTSYIYSKRLNRAKGTYPGFYERIKRKLIANTDSEATLEAEKLTNRLEQLQRVCLRDQNQLHVSTSFREISFTALSPVIATNSLRNLAGVATARFLAGRCARFVCFK